MSNEKNHWREAFKSDYLSFLDLPEGQDIIVTIKELKLEHVKGKKKGENFCNIAYFEEGIKPMILNVTNSKMVRKLSGGSNFIQDWAGTKVQIYFRSNVKFGLETVGGLRIRDFAPTPKAVNVDVKGAKAKLSKCKTLDELKKVYTSLPKDQLNNADVISHKDEMKGKLA